MFVVRETMLQFILIVIHLVPLLPEDSINYHVSKEQRPFALNLLKVLNISIGVATTIWRFECRSVTVPKKSLEAPLSFQSLDAFLDGSFKQSLVVGSKGWKWNGGQKCSIHGFRGRFPWQKRFEDASISVVSINVNVDHWFRLTFVTVHVTAIDGLKSSFSQTDGTMKRLTVNKTSIAQRSTPKAWRMVWLSDRCVMYVRTDRHQQ